MQPLNDRADPGTVLFLLGHLVGTLDIISVDHQIGTVSILQHHFLIDEEGFRFLPFVARWHRCLILEHPLADLC